MSRRSFIKGVPESVSLQLPSSVWMGSEQFSPRRKMVLGGMTDYTYKLKLFAKRFSTVGRKDYFLDKHPTTFCVTSVKLREPLNKFWASCLFFTKLIHRRREKEKENLSYRITLSFSLALVNRTPSLRRLTTTTHLTTTRSTLIDGTLV